MRLFALLLLLPCWTLAAEAETTFFDPVALELEGWTIQVDPALLPGGDAAALGSNALSVLQAQLIMIRQVLPAEPLTKLRSCPIWMEHNHPTLGSLQYHPGVDWLIKNDCDPRLVRHVHIPRAEHLVAPYMMRKQPWVMIHELAHAYHQRIITHAHPGVNAAWKKAKANGSYERVQAYNGRMVRHYALSNVYEYFAEASEAYIGSNDFYPFVRAELKQHDPDMYAVMREVWGKL